MRRALIVGGANGIGLSIATHIAQRDDYDRVYMSKVFTFTDDCHDVYSCEVIKGGTGYDIASKLPEEIENVLNNVEGVSESIVVERNGRLIALVQPMENFIDWDNESEEKIYQKLDEWKKKILRARHSPIRELRFAFELKIPYWVSVHLCRHVHAQPYVRSQRNDRQDEYDRNAARQDEPVTMIWTMNAEELMTIANKRLCKQASKETREVMEMIKWIVEHKCPEFKDLLVPACQYNGKCHEMFPCGGVNNGT